MGIAGAQLLLAEQRVPKKAVQRCFLLSVFKTIVLQKGVLQIKSSFLVWKRNLLGSGELMKQLLLFAEMVAHTLYKLYTYTFVYCKDYKANRMQATQSKGSSDSEGYFTGPPRSSKMNSSKKSDKAILQLLKPKSKSKGDEKIKASEEEADELLFLPIYAQPQPPSISSEQQLSKQQPEGRPPSNNAQKSQHDLLQSANGMKMDLKPLQPSQNIDLRASRAVVQLDCAESAKQINKAKEQGKANGFRSIARKEEEASNSKDQIIYFQKSLSENENGSALTERARQSLNYSTQTYVEGANNPEPGQILNTSDYSIETIAGQSDGRAHQLYAGVDEIHNRGSFRERENAILPPELTARNTSDDQGKQEKDQLQQNERPTTESGQEDCFLAASLQDQTSYKWPEANILGLVFDCCAGWLFKRKFQTGLQRLLSKQKPGKAMSGYQRLGSEEQQEKKSEQTMNFNRHMFLKRCELKIKESKERQALYQRGRQQQEPKSSPETGIGRDRDRNCSLSTVRQEEIQESSTELYEDEKLLTELNAGFSESRRRPLQFVSFQKFSDRKYKEGLEKAQLFRAVSSTPLVLNSKLFQRERDNCSKANHEKRLFEQKMARRLNRINSSELGRQRAQLLIEEQLRREAKKREEFVEVQVPAANNQRSFKAKFPVTWQFQFV